jgi:hypothetical protein
LVSIRESIRETPAPYALDGSAHAFPVAVAKQDPVIVAEIKLRQIPMQMLFVAMLIDALHAALED